MPAGSAEGQAVEVSVDIAARPATVWRCLIEADLLSRWLQATATLEPQVGGAVRFDFPGLAGEHYVIEGVVAELRPNEVLAFTWGVSVGPQHDSIPVGSTRVHIRLAETPSGTRVTLHHEGLPDEKERQAHTTGWTGLLGGLSGLAPAVATHGGLETMWDAWFAAWGETDAAKRDALLNRCFAEDGMFRDIHTDGRGRAWLSGWIEYCQRTYPVARLVRDGAVLHCRSSVLVRWRAESADGRVTARGINYGRLTPDGTLAAVEGFWEAASSPSG